MATGFASHETFTRAFRRQFGRTPSEYRTAHASWDADSVRHSATTAPCVGLYRKPLANNVQENPMTDYNIEQQDLDETPVLFGRRKLEKDKIADGLAQVLPAAFGHAMNNGFEMVGPPFVRYADQSAAFFTIEAGVPLAAPAPDPGADSGLSVGTLPGGKAAFTVHQGPSTSPTLPKSPTPQTGSRTSTSPSSVASAAASLRHCDSRKQLCM